MAVVSFWMREDLISCCKWSMDVIGMVLYFDIYPCLSVDRHLGIFAAGVPCWHSFNWMRRLSGWHVVTSPRVGCRPFILIGISNVLSIGSDDSVT